MHYEINVSIFEKKKNLTALIIISINYNFFLLNLKVSFAVNWL